MQRVIDRMHTEETTICLWMTETAPVSVQTSTDKYQWNVVSVRWLQSTSGSKNCR